MCECKCVYASVVEMTEKNGMGANSFLVCLGVFWGWFGFLFTALIFIFTLPSIFTIYLLDIVQPSEDKVLLILTAYSTALVKGGLLSSPLRILRG